MEGTQYCLMQLNETINRLERVSDADELTGLYNRRAGEKRLAEEVARAERDLQGFQVALFDINDFKRVNDQARPQRGRRLHLARGGPAAAQHAARGLARALGRRRVRRGPAPQPRVEAGDRPPREGDRGEPLRDRPRRGAHRAACVRRGRVSLRRRLRGLIADADRALYAAKELVRRDPRSQICYRSELDLPARSEREALPAQ